MTGLILASVPASGGLPVGRARLVHAAWAEARRIGARFVLAVDDTGPLLKGGAAKGGAPVEDLAWLGVEWDEMFLRSGQGARYGAAAAVLEAAGRLYPCFEHADELRAKAERQRKAGRAILYDRAMLRLTPAQRASAEAGGKRAHWRFRLSDGVVGWADARAGRCEVALPLMSDPVLRDEDGGVDAALALAADDMALGVTQIVSGAEVLAVTAVHLDLLAALGAAGERGLLHLPAPAEEDGRRVQGRSVRSLRADGVTPAGLRAWFESLGRARAPRARIADLLAANRRALASTPFAEVAHLLPGVDEAGWLARRGGIDLVNEARDEG
jgi:glutamyl-tRNA synthetase